MNNCPIPPETLARLIPAAPLHTAEEFERGAALKEQAILDTPPDARFDAVARAAAAIAGMPVALISMVDARRYWFKANVGLPGMSEVPRAIAFCEATIETREPLVVEDLRREPRFAGNPTVTGAPNFCFYAGWPLHDAAGTALGVLCVLDHAPRQLDAAQRSALSGLAQLTMELLAQHGRDADMRLLRAFSDTAPAQVYVCGPGDLRFVYANPAGLARIGGAPPMARRLLNRLSLADVQSWMSPGSMRQVVAQAIAAAPQPTVLQVRQPGDPVTDLQMRVVPFAHEGRDLVGIALTDISQWKGAERAHRLEMERWQVAIEQTGDGLWDWSVQSGAVFYSPGWSALLGHAPDEIKPDYAEWVSRIHPDDGAQARADMTRCFDSADGALHSEVRMRCKDGSYTWILHRGRVTARDAQGLPMRLIGIAMSTAVRRELQESLQALNAGLEQRVAARTSELAAINQDLRLFSGAAAHDLAAPLRGVEGFASLLQLDYAAQLPDDARQLLAQIKSGALRMQALLNALAAFFQVSERTPRVEPVDMNAAAQVALEMHAQTIAARSGLRITVDSMPPAAGDPALVQNVFSTLISNSLKFTRERSAALIEIGWFEFDGRPAYYVEDNGAGFDPEFAHRLFQPLSRLHDGSRFEGTGLGLATAARIVSRDGGRIWAQGAVDAGACFAFQFGLARTPTAAQPNV